MSDKEYVIERLEALLMKEYLQRDVYETYSYYLFGFVSPSIQQHLKEHRDEENKHIEILQRYLADYDVSPLTDRHEIPEISGTIDIDKIVELDLELEEEAVKEYSDFIDDLENMGREFSSLRIEMENILIQEQEHVHDLRQWMKTSL